MKTLIQILQIGLILVATIWFVRKIAYSGKKK